MEPKKTNNIEELPGLIRPASIGDGMTSTATPASNERINRPAPVSTPAPWVPGVVGGVLGGVAGLGLVVAAAGVTRLRSGRMKMGEMEEGR